jgi:hypothetical protein
VVRAGHGAVPFVVSELRHDHGADDEQCRDEERMAVPWRTGYFGWVAKTARWSADPACPSTVMDVMAAIVDLAPVRVHLRSSG